MLKENTSVLFSNIVTHKTDTFIKQVTSSSYIQASYILMHSHTLCNKCKV